MPSSAPYRAVLGKGKEQAPECHPPHSKPHDWIRGVGGFNGRVRPRVGSA